MNLFKKMIMIPLLRKMSFALLMLSVVVACNNNTSPKEPVPLKTDTVYMRTGFYFLTDTVKGVRMLQETTGKVYSLERKPFAAVDNIVVCNIEEFKTDSTADKYLQMKFDEEGTRNLLAATENPLQAKVALVVGNRLLYVVANNARIETGVVSAYVTDYSPEEIAAMVQAIKEKR